MQLPVTLRPVFDPFELSEGPRSPRAPAPSEPIYLDAEDVEGEEEVTRNRDQRKPNALRRRSALAVATTPPATNGLTLRGARSN